MMTSVWQRRVGGLALMLGFAGAAGAVGNCAVNWTARTASGVSSALESVAWSGTQFVAVGDGTTIATSPDGVTWTKRLVACGSANFQDVAWSGSRFVAVGSGGLICSSADGVTWSSVTVTPGTTNTLFAVTWAGSQFVAGGQNGVLFTSPDGTSWTGQDSQTSAQINAISWSGERLVAVGGGGAILTSSDGISWQTQTSGTTNNLNAVVWSGNKFLVVGQSGRLLTSADGAAWTSATINGGKNLFGLAWSGGEFVAVGFEGSLISSADGVNWSSRTSGATGNLRSVTWSGEQFLTVGLGATIRASACPWGDGLSLANDRWTQIGLPALPDDATVGGVFGGLTGTYNVDWSVWRFDAGTNSYVNLPSTSTAMDQSTGYWLKSINGAATPSLAGTATPLVTANANCPSAGGCYELALVPDPAGATNRANLVSFPLPFPIGWWDARIEVDGVAYTPSAAELAGYVSKTYYVWNGSSYDSYDDVTAGATGMLQPWQGIWVMVLPNAVEHTVKLLIPAIPKVSLAPAESPASWVLRALDWLIPAAMADAAVPARGARTPAYGDGTVREGWYVRFVVEAPEEKLADRNTLLGQFHDTLAGFDAHDLPALAPFGAPYLSAVLPHPEWGEHAGDYNSDYRPVPAGLGTDRWELRIDTDRARKVRLRWEGPDAVLRRSVLIDGATGRRYNAASARLKRDGLWLELSTGGHRFSWVYKGGRK